MAVVKQHRLIGFEIERGHRSESYNPLFTPVQADVAPSNNIGCEVMWKYAEDYDVPLSFECKRQMSQPCD